MRYRVIATVTFDVDVPEPSECPERDAEAIVEAHLEEDELVGLYSMAPTRPFRLD